MVTSTVEKLTDTRVKLAITVTPDELKPSIKHAYEHIAKDINVPGFRKGKVPAPIIDQRVGKGYVLEHAINDGLDSFYRAAIAENDLRPLGNPSADIAEYPSDKDFSGDLLVTIEVDVRPEIELPDYAGLEVTVDSVTVTDDEVDAELQNLRTRFGTLVTVDRPAKTGDFAQIDLVASVDGNIVDTANGISHELGSGELIEGVDEALDSLSAGEETTFTAPLLGGDFAGQDAEIAVKVHAVKERELPEADDDFAQIASEFDTIAELRDDLRTQVEKRKSFSQGSQARDLLVDKLLEQLQIPVPPALIDEEVRVHLENEGKEQDDPHGDEVREQSEKSFRNQMLLDAIAEKEDVKVSQQELSSYILQRASQAGYDPSEYLQALQQQNQIPVAVGEVARTKAVAIVLDKATVVDSEGKPVDVTPFTAIIREEEASEEA